MIECYFMERIISIVSYFLALLLNKVALIQMRYYTFTLYSEFTFYVHFKEFVRVTFSDMFDSVVTVFFLDTAHNVIAYIETIYDILKPGGYWVNLGNVTSIYMLYCESIRLISFCMYIWLATSFCWSKLYTGMCFCCH